MSFVLTHEGQRIDDGRVFARDEQQAGNAVSALPAWKERGGVDNAVWLAPNDDPHELSARVGRLNLIGVDFPKFTDGRGYSTAWLLRMRYGFAGDLRAIGDVLIDQLYYMRRVGFSSFALKPGQDEAAAVRALSTFSDHYQGSATGVPAFRRTVRPSAEIR
jgi:uncharacterized protein (DUF934 family)